MSEFKRVIANFGFDVLCKCPKTGAMTTHKYLKSKQRPVVGDWVEIAQDVVSRIKPRHNELKRLRDKHKSSSIATNIEQLGIVLSSEPFADWYYIDTWLLAAWIHKIEPILLLNKSDLPSFDAWVKRFRQRYEATNISYWIGSVQTSAQVEQLKALLNNKVNLLVGLSGVGKSSITNALIPDLTLKTQTLSNFSGLGKHTTTNTLLHYFDDTMQGGIIDSPGIKSLDIEIPEDISPAWPEFAPFLGTCQFRNCHHLHEPQCAIRTAMEQGQIHQSRYENYHHLQEMLGRKNLWD